MSYSYLPLGIRYRLWAKAAGRCEYLGCNDALWRDAATQTELNKAYIAHIVADSPGGPRGDAVRSELLKCELANLMLLCDAHHRLIDREGLAEHPEARLLDMKARHEHRIEMSTAATHAHRSHVVFYGANVGKHAVQLTMEAARAAMLPEWHPADPTPRRLGMTNSTWDDRATPPFGLSKGRIFARMSTSRFVRALDPATSPICRCSDLRRNRCSLSSVP